MVQYNKKILTNLVTVNENNLVANKPVTVIINKDEHNEINDTGNYYELIGTFKICETGTDNCTVTPFMFTVQIPKNGNINVDGREIIITFEPGDVVIRADYKTLENDLQAIRGILENRVDYFKYNIAQQITVLETLFSSIVGPVPLVFFEAILSELYRCPKDLSQPVRLCGADYSKASAVDIKKAIHNNGSLERAVGYGYTKEAIATNISSDKKVKKDSLLDIVKSNKEQE